LQGSSPKDMAPNLYKNARFKNRSGHSELTNHNWIRNLGVIGSAQLLDEFVLLYLAITSVTLTDQRDEITWRWTSNGKYSVASAYDCQFIGSMTSLPPTDIWTAATEPKCNFFTWLVMHDKAPTADNLSKKNWPCNPTCPLCFCQPETAGHLLSQCNFYEALWNVAAGRYNLPNFNILSTRGGPLEWARYLLLTGNKKERKNKLGILFFFWWQVWKERNRRIFEDK
jgi:hypothetical protein